ncbi:hypothetical protein [Nitrospira japonica]|uniref:hypothetical protein n=1 Tax=Nitrospira japonica TaxID=1325564 RepID=UPI0012DD180A|nr:hypothetical protein [Nitrospira japonica]
MELFFGATVVLFDWDVAAAIGKGPDVMIDEEMAGAEELILGVNVRTFVESPEVVSAWDEMETDWGPEAEL